jgi:tetratricopeptide (TPR) repeat protein
VNKHSDPERDLAERLLAASRKARWTFPTSLGRPIFADTPDWARSLLDERSNLVAAATWFRAQLDFSSAIELAANAWRLWVLALDDEGGRHFLSGVLDVPGIRESGRFSALALYGDGLLAFRLGKLDESYSRNEEALRIARLENDRESEGLSHLGLSRVAESERRGPETTAHAKEAYSLLCDFGIEYRQAPLHMRAQAARLNDDLDEAAALFDASVALNRAIGDRGMVIVDLHNLGHVECRRGDVDRAEKCFEECTILAGETDDPYELALRMFNQAWVAYGRSSTHDARSLLARARALLSERGAMLSTDDAREFKDLQRRLGE